MDYILYIFKKNVVNFFILLICKILIKINSLHVGTTSSKTSDFIVIQDATTS